MNVLSMMGEAVMRMASDAVKGSDGSYIAVQTNKGSYRAGETMHGYVVAQLNSPRQVDRVLVKVSCKEKVYWDEEIARTITEGEGENARTRTVYEHHSRQAKVVYLKEVVVASQLPHMLGAGSYSYPFAYTFRADLPGCTRFVKEWQPQDPAWRNAGRMLRIRAEVVYKVKALFDVNGIFARDLKSKQEVTVNSFFDWEKMKPAFGQNQGQVRFCCCIPRGEVKLSASFDRAAYMAGETAQIKAAIVNDSEQDVAHMVVKLMRFITLRDQAGHQKQIVDTVCQATYPGVAKKSQATRDLPLPLHNSSGALLAGTKARTIEISYRFDVECDLFCAPDLEVHLPMILFAPEPATWGLAAMGLAVPAGITFSFPVAPVAAAPVMAVAAVPQQPMMVAAPQMQMAVAAPQPVSPHVMSNPAAVAMSMPGMQVQMQMPTSPGGYPQQQGGYPPQQQGGYPPQQQGGYPPQQQGGYPPQQGGYPPQQQAMGMQMQVGGGSMGGAMPGQMGMGSMGGMGVSGHMTMSSSSTSTVNGQVVEAHAAVQSQAM